MKIWEIIDIIKWTTKFFKEHNIESARLEAEYILSHVLKISRFNLYLDFEKPLSDIERKTIKEFVVRRANHEPLQYIFGKIEFYNYPFYINQNVLIPRPETEFLVEKIITENPKTKKILDIGTGSGVIAISLAKELPLSQIFASDISEKALTIAKQNAITNSAKIKFFHSDVFSHISGKFDLIVSNPPYISKTDYLKLDQEIRNFEPTIALTTSDKGLAIYKKILDRAYEFLELEGLIYFEIGYNQAEDISKYAESKGFSLLEICKDLNKYDRILKFKKI